MSRKSLSRRERRRVYDAARQDNGGHPICPHPECGHPIDPRDRWEAHHDIAPAAFGGRHMVPMHAACHRDYTARFTAPLVAKSNRQRKKHLGLKRSHHPLPCGKRSRKSKTMRHGVVPRMTLAQKHAAMLEARRISP